MDSDRKSLELLIEWHSSASCDGGDDGDGAHERARACGDYDYDCACGDCALGCAGLCVCAWLR